MTRPILLVVALAGCILCDESDYSGPRMLTVSGGGTNTRYEGNGIACGVSDACDGSSDTRCSVALDRGTPIRIEAINPVCVPAEAFPAFQWSAPCREQVGRTCEFELQYDVQITVTPLSGSSAAR